MLVGLKFGQKLCLMLTEVRIKFITLQSIVCWQKDQRKIICGILVLDMREKMLVWRPKGGLKCKIFMGAKDIQGCNLM